MAPDVKSLSWRRTEDVHKTSGNRHSRKRLTDMFDEAERKPSGGLRQAETSPLRSVAQCGVLPKLRLRIPRVSPTRKAFRNGADRLARTFQQLRISIGTFSQRLRGPTRRRRPLENIDTPSATPQTRSRRLLGRTPTAMYSPFGIESPKVCSLEPATPRRRGKSSVARQSSHRSPATLDTDQENERPLTRSFIQTQAMLCQPSPTCNSLLD